MLPAIQKYTSQNISIPKAAVILLGSLFLYTIQDATIKSLASKYSVFELIFFRCLFSLLPLFFFALLEQKQSQSLRTLFRTQHLTGQILRSGLMFLSLLFYFMALRHLPLTSVYALSYTSPLFMTLFSVPLLHEQVGLYRSLAVIAGFMGIFIVLHPGGETFQPYGLYAVASGLCTGISVILGKRLCAKDSNTLIVFMYTAMGIIGSALILPFVWVTPDLQSLSYFLMIGILGGIAQFGFTHAFRLAPVSALAPFDYCGLIWASIVGYILWHEIPNHYTIVGTLLIISMGILTLYREKK